VIDLRSDTVTKPTVQMREAMFHAQVGDDVYGDDTTTIELERLAAEIFSKKAALFVPSGTFGNQVALLTHTKRGDEVILSEDAHIQVHEVGAASVIAGVQLRTVPSKRGQMPLDRVKQAIRKYDIHYPNTGLICVENAHGCGAVLDLDYLEKLYTLAKEHNLPVHMDGARVFNAAEALGVSVKEIAKYCDTINVCLSKGLCAPVGSLLLGDETFIQVARKNRKLMGGGMRQTGILAAAGIVAITEMPKYLKDDHKKAKTLASRLDAINGVEVLWDYRDINMVFFKLTDDLADLNENLFVGLLAEKGILINGTEDGLYRFVTHYWISWENIDQVCENVAEIFTKWRHAELTKRSI
jgi:threonine aldolase